MVIITVKEIGELFNIRYSSVSIKTKKFEEKLKKNKDMNKKRIKLRGLYKVKKKYKDKILF